MRGPGGSAAPHRPPYGGPLTVGLRLGARLFAGLVLTGAVLAGPMLGGTEAAAEGPAGVLAAVDLRGLEARSAALLMSGQEAGDLEASFLALPLASAGERQPIVLVADLVGSSLLETAGDELILELYVYALGAEGGLLASSSRAFRIDVASWRPHLERGGVKYLGRLDLPAGEAALRILALHRASGRFALRTVPVELAAGGESPAEAAPATIAAPPFAVDDPEPWLVIDGSAGTPLPPPFATLSPLPATRVVAARDGSGPLRVTAGGEPPPRARLLDLEGRPLVELRPAGEPPVGGLVELDLAAPELAELTPQAYLLELSPANASAPAVRLPLELVASRGPGDLVWFQRPTAPEASSGAVAAAAGDTRRNEPHQLALAAYRRAFEAWREGGLVAAATELRRFEAAALEATAAAGLEAGQLRAAGELAAADPEGLVPLMCLHEFLFRDYHDRGGLLLATHSRRLADRYARLYASRGRGPEAGRTAALVLVSVAGMRQESGTRLAALATFEAALALDPQQPEALLAMAALHESLGGYETVVELLRRLGKVQPLAPAAQLRLAVNLDRVGSRRQALALLDKLAGKPPEWVSGLAFQERARILDGDQRAAEALEVVEEALVHHPGEQALVLQRAALLDRLGRSLESRQALATLAAGGGDRGDSARLRYSALPSTELAAARSRLAAAATDRLDGLLEAGGGAAPGAP